MNRRTSTAMVWGMALVLVASLVACGPKEEPPPAPMMEMEKEEAPAEPVAPPPAPDTSGDETPSPLDGEVVEAYKYAVREGLLGDIFFDFDKYDLRPDARERLRKNADFMREFPDFTYGLEGHCDERGTNEYNLALGERRANAAKDYLVALGVESARLRTISYGEERPFCTTHDETCWQLNRRGHFVMTGRSDAG
ncbi:MAG: peptidoglycan-associated lipoprotein Pal [Thermoanaerobaculia bacterium]